MAATGVVGIRTNTAKIALVMAPPPHKSQNSRQNNRLSIIAPKHVINLKTASLIASDENAKRISQKMR
jgi:hypothetical protein